MSSISEELFLAILAMDSYNREYNPGIKLDGSTIGNAKILDRKLEIDISDTKYQEWQSAGFYAVAYQTEYGTVISYRGTDNLFTLPWSDAPGSDIWNSYGMGAGAPFTNAARLAAEFYQAVTATKDSDPSTGSAILTGHSLGGGLAG